MVPDPGCHPSAQQPALLVQLHRQRDDLDLRDGRLRRADRCRPRNHLGRSQPNLAVQGPSLHGLAQRHSGFRFAPHRRRGRHLVGAAAGQRRRDSDGGHRCRRQDQRQRRRLRVLAGRRRQSEHRLRQVDRRRRHLQCAAGHRHDFRNHAAPRHSRRQLAQPPRLHLGRRIPDRHQGHGLCRVDRPQRRRRLHHGWRPRQQHGLDLQDPRLVHTLDGRRHDLVGAGEDQRPSGLERPVPLAALRRRVRTA